MLTKSTYSIYDVYILMQERNNYFICIHPYEFKCLSFVNSIISGKLVIENRIIPFEIDASGIISTCKDSTNSIIIGKYIFTLL
ncbi:MAG: hypothetical protein ACTHJT_12105 [Cytophaga sp.]|uniref:hypothetical protein n=1 Tax=Cytophaga sp. TaxID=29535 RepID=UPI003F8198F9